MPGRLLSSSVRAKLTAANITIVALGLLIGGALGFAFALALLWVVEQRSPAVAAASAVALLIVAAVATALQAPPSTEIDPRYATDRALAATAAQLAAIATVATIALEIQSLRRSS